MPLSRYTFKCPRVEPGLILEDTNGNPIGMVVNYDATRGEAIVMVHNIEPPLHMSRMYRDADLRNASVLPPFTTINFPIIGTKAESIRIHL